MVIHEIIIQTIDQKGQLDCQSKRSAGLSIKNVNWIAERPNAMKSSLMTGGLSLKVLFIELNRAVSGKRRS